MKLEAEMRSGGTMRDCIVCLSLPAESSLQGLGDFTVISKFTFLPGYVLDFGKTILKLYLLPILSLQL